MVLYTFFNAKSLLKKTIKNGMFPNDPIVALTQLVMPLQMHQQAKKIEDKILSLNRIYLVRMTNSLTFKSFLSLKSVQKFIRFTLQS